MFDENKGFIAWEIPKENISQFIPDFNLFVHEEHLSNRTITKYVLDDNSFVISKIGNIENNFITLEGSKIKEFHKLNNQIMSLPFKLKAKKTEIFEFISNISFMERNFKLYTKNNKLLLVYEFENDKYIKDEINFLKEMILFKIEEEFIPF